MPVLNVLGGAGGSSRRIRIAGIAVVMTIVILFLGLQAPVGIQAAPAPDAAVKQSSSWSAGQGYQQQQQQAQESPKAEEAVHAPTIPTPVAEEAGGASDGDKEETSLEEPSSTTVQSASPTPSVECPSSFEAYQRQMPGPPSEGKRKFPYVRPPPGCRTFDLPDLEALIEKMKGVIKDPDLFRLFENSYPNTLDTMVKWRGYARKPKPDEVEPNLFSDEKPRPPSPDDELTDEELTYVITGDIDAMWLRDSASQIYSYLPLLKASDSHDSLASLWRGLINSHSRYIVISPYCHSFQPPPESGIPPTHNGAYTQNHPNPPYEPKKVFDCKWELDSLASFLQISAAYHDRTGDLAFFGKHSWVDAVRAAVDASAAMRLGTYDDEGRVLPSAWTFTGWTDRGSETLTNNGLGNPVKENGMVRSAFRPSDDACIFQLLTPSNMMFAAYLEQASVIMEGLNDAAKGTKNLTVAMRDLAAGIRRGIARDAVVHHRDFGEIFAYEVDGYGGANLMDDANVPSLLAMPLWNYTSLPTSKGSAKTARIDAAASGNNNSSTDDKDTKKEEAEEKHDYAKIYQNTRRFVLSMANPYYAKGPALSAVGGPHLGPGKGWPMAATVAGLTAFENLAGFDDKTRQEAVAEQLEMVLNSTSGKGVIHETVNAWNKDDFTRAWFGWANGLFGELILRIAEDEERRGISGTEKGLLGRSWQ